VAELERKPWQLVLPSEEKLDEELGALHKEKGFFRRCEIEEPMTVLEELAFVLVAISGPARKQLPPAVMKLEQYYGLCDFVDGVDAELAQKKQQEVMASPRKKIRFE
jgi:hypothetical protein